MVFDINHFDDIIGIDLKDKRAPFEEIFVDGGDKYLSDRKYKLKRQEERSRPLP